MSVQDLLVSDDFKGNIFAGAIFLVIEVAAIVILLPLVQRFLDKRRWRITREHIYGTLVIEKVAVSNSLIEAARAANAGPPEQAEASLKAFAERAHSTTSLNWLGAVGLAATPELVMTISDMCRLKQLVSLFIMQEGIGVLYDILRADLVRLKSADERLRRQIESFMRNVQELVQGIEETKTIASKWSDQRNKIVRSWQVS